MLLTVTTYLSAFRHEGVLVGGHAVLGWSEEAAAPLFGSSNALSTHRTKVITSRTVALLGARYSTREVAHHTNSQGVLVSQTNTRGGEGEAKSSLVI